MFLIAGVLAVERGRSDPGQVVDLAMVDGVSTLLAMHYSMRASGLLSNSRGSNLLDGGAPFYDTYACADGRYVAVGAIEPQFFEALVQRLRLEDLPEQNDRTRWPELRARLEAAFARRPREAWLEVFSETDARVTPVLDLDERADHPQVGGPSRSTGSGSQHRPRGFPALPVRPPPAAPLRRGTGKPISMPPRKPQRKRVAPHDADRSHPARSAGSRAMSSALVTGGASGLGRPTAEALRSQGLDVVVHDLPTAAERLEPDSRLVFVRG